MEKKREQELSVLEVLRLHREFHLPRPVPADGQEKPLDKVKAVSYTHLDVYKRQRQDGQPCGVHRSEKHGRKS